MNQKNAHMARRRMSHVIDELYTALFRAGSLEADMKICREKQGLRLLVRSEFSHENLRAMERMAELLTPQVRNPALVEAYWELAGGDQYTSDSEMSLVGQMLDEARISFDGDSISMDLYLAF